MDKNDDFGNRLINIFIEEPSINFYYKAEVSITDWIFLVDFSRSVLRLDESIQRELRE